MKKGFWVGIVGLLGVCLLVVVVGATGQMKSVSVKETALRMAPMPFGRIIMTLRYGDRVTVEKEDHGWLQVREQRKGSQGWVHLSALTGKRIVLQAGEGDVEAVATGEELALAGKGFNRQVESSFKERNRQLDYAAVDRMETVVISSSLSQEFIRTGGLHEWGGAANAR